MQKQLFSKLFLASSGGVTSRLLKNGTSFRLNEHGNFWLCFPGTFMAHVRTGAATIVLVGKAAIQCLEIHENLRSLTLSYKIKSLFLGKNPISAASYE